MGCTQGAKMGGDGLQNLVKMRPWSLEIILSLIHSGFCFTNIYWALTRYQALCARCWAQPGRIKRKKGLGAYLYRA